jgi:hypothetical protein
MLYECVLRTNNVNIIVCSVGRTVYRHHHCQQTDGAFRCFVMPVHQHGPTRYPMEGFSWNMTFDFFDNLRRIFNFHYNLIRITGTLHKDLCIFMIIPRRIRGARWRTNRQVTSSIPDGVIEIFQWHNPSGSTMALGSTQPLTKMSTRCIS